MRMYNCSEQEDCPVVEVQVLRRDELRIGFWGAATDGEGGKGIRMWICGARCSKARSHGMTLRGRSSLPTCAV